MELHRRFSPTTSRRLNAAWNGFLTFATLFTGFMATSPFHNDVADGHWDVWFAMPLFMVIGMLLFLPVVWLVRKIRGPLYRYSEEVLTPRVLIDSHTFYSEPSLEGRYIQRDLRKALREDLSTIEAQIPSLRSWVGTFRNNKDGERRLLWRDKKRLEKILRRHGLDSRLKWVGSEEACSLREERMNKAQQRWERRFPEDTGWFV